MTDVNNDYIHYDTSQLWTSPIHWRVKCPDDLWPFMLRGLETWASCIALTYERVTSGENFLVDWSSAYGPSIIADSPGSTPYGIIYANSNNSTMTGLSTSSVVLWQVFAHEIGHNLGLQHKVDLSPDGGYLMMAIGLSTTITQGEARAMRALYGAPASDGGHFPAQMTLTTSPQTFTYRGPKCFGRDMAAMFHSSVTQVINAGGYATEWIGPGGSYTNDLPWVRATPTSLSDTTGYGAGGAGWGNHYEYDAVSGSGYNAFINYGDTITVYGTVGQPVFAEYSSTTYAVNFTPHDARSTGAGEMGYQVCILSGGVGILASGSCTSGSPVSVSVYDDRLVADTNVRYLRTRDGAGNWTETSFLLSYGARPPTPRAWLTVDALLWLMDYRRRVTAAGTNEWDLTLSSVDLHYMDAFARLAAQMQEYRGSGTELKQSNYHIIIPAEGYLGSGAPAGSWSSVFLHPSMADILALVKVTVSALQVGGAAKNVDLIISGTGVPGGTATLLSNVDITAGVEYDLTDFFVQAPTPVPWPDAGSGVGDVIVTVGLHAAGVGPYQYRLELRIEATKIPLPPA